MVSESLTKMLILQDRDMKLQEVEGALKSIPLERKAGQGRIAGLNGQIEATRQRIKELEARGGVIETEMASIEVQVVKYKNQQLDVKKNEEYQALTHEIEMAGKKISDLESEELEVLYGLDEARKEQVEEAKIFAKQIGHETEDLGILDKKEELMKNSLAGAKEAFEAASADLDNPTRSKYKQVARGLKFPVIVPLRKHACGGCHMRVSNVIDADVRAAAEIITCDNCGRVLYSAS